MATICNAVLDDEMDVTPENPYNGGKCAICGKPLGKSFSYVVNDAGQITSAYHAECVTA